MREASVTVVIPVHNGETFVSDALSAALSQRHQPGEAIVVNDGSGGGRAVSCAPFRPEIRIVRRSHRGFSATYKRGVALVRGDHAARCNADDTWESNLLERQCSALREHRRIDIAAGAAWMFGLEERMFANLVREDGRLVAGTEYLGGLRYRVALRELIWTAIRSLVVRFRRRLVNAGVRIRRALATRRPEDLSVRA